MRFTLGPSAGRTTARTTARTMGRRRALVLTIASAVAVTGATSYAVAGAAHSARPAHVQTSGGTAPGSPVADLLHGSYHADFQRLSSDKPTIENTVAPAIVGRARVGEVVTATPGTWDPAAVRTSYQWFAGGNKISGATTKSLTLKPGHLDAKITVEVTAKKAHYRGAVADSRPAKVRLGTLKTLKAPTLSGKSKVGQTLAATSGRYSVRGTDISYQWFRGNKALKGASHATYRLRTADKGAKMTVVVSAAKRGYREASSTLTARGKVV